MEQEHHQLIVHEEEEEEEVEDGALKRRQSLLHSKDNLVTGVVASSSSSSSLASNGSEHSNGVCSVVADQDGSSVQKEEEEVAKMGNVGENGKHFDNDTVDDAAVGLGLVAEFTKIGNVGENSKHFDNDTVDDGAVGLGLVAEFTKIGNVGENDKHFDNDTVDDAAVGLGLVAEFVKTATNGEGITGATFSPAVSQNENSVYFDKQQDNEVNGLNGVQNGDAVRSVYPTSPEASEFDVQAKTSDIQNSLCSKVNNQCIEMVDDKVPSSSELSPLHNSSDIQATAVVNSHEAANLKEGPNLINKTDQQLKELDVEVVLAKQETHDLFCPNCNSCITKRVILKKRKRNIHKLDNKAKRDKLDTVVSSKLVDNSAHVANQGDHANVTSDITNVEPPADNDHLEREPEVFRCLSCFSFFIPSGKGFNLFRNFGGASKQETPQNPSSINARDLQNPSNLLGSNANWFISIFTSNKGKTATEKGDTSREHSRTGSAEQHHLTSITITSNMLTSPEIGHPEGPLADTALIKDVKPVADINNEHGGMNSMIENDIKSHMASGNEPLADRKSLDSSLQNDLSSLQSSTKNAGDGMNGVDLSAKEQFLTGDQRTNEGEKKNASVNVIKTNNVEVMFSMSFSDDMVSKSESVQLGTAATSETLVNAGETAKDAILNPFEGEQFLAPTPGSPILEKSQKDVDRTPEIVENSHSSLRQGTQLPVQSFGSTVVASEVASNKQSSGIDAIFPSKLDFPLKEKMQKVVDEEINPSVRKENTGGDVIVIVEREARESKTSQTADIVPVTESHTQVGEQPRNEIGEPQQWEILKSIVYGGLVESITSLGIVSSAVSSGATPLNIIVLGFANLIGGLFILGHILNDLKNDHSGGDQQQTDVQDRYQELLGRRENFWLHAVVAVLSFIIFGSIPLIIYGLLISKNYYAEVKLAIVAATSLVCIILLAIGKVYTTRQPKSYIKTLLYYVTLALASSGISYIGGNLIKDLLEKFNHSEPGFAIAMPISDTSMKSAWMSY